MNFTTECSFIKHGQIRIARILRLYSQILIKFCGLNRKNHNYASIENFLLGRIKSGKQMIKKKPAQKQALYSGDVF